MAYVAMCGCQGDKQQKENVNTVALGITATMVILLHCHSILLYYKMC